MEVETAQPPSGGSDSSSSAAYPRWVTLEGYCECNVDSSCRTGVTKTLAAAAARTSNGRPIHVSLSLAEPPATSAVCVKFPGGAVHLNYSIVMAAHCDSLLIAVNFRQGYGYDHTYDYFVYNLGDAAADPPRPPSLLLLPHYYLSESKNDPVNRELDTHCTGILHHRRGEDEDEVVVAELKMVATTKDSAENTKVAELFLFRSGAWSVKRPWIFCGNDDDFGELHSEWTTSSVFPVGDSILCWADEFSDDGGVLICDLLEESPCLQYVSLPLVPTPYFGRKVCATADGTMLKFVNIFPRCCCGGAGVSDCQHSHHAYTINTWTLRMDNGMRMEWVMDGMVDAELWSLDNYKGLPRVPLGLPVVSINESHVMCFSLCEKYHVKHGGDKTLLLLMVDMRSKTIQSVSRHTDWSPGRPLMSSNVSYYLNPYPTCSSDGTSIDQSQCSEMENEKKKTDDDGMNSMLPSPCLSTKTETAAQAYDEILAAFLEIASYGLTGDDMLKAYAILSCDNGCRLRSLLRLPMKLRKDWLLMEIKAADGDQGGRCFDP